jgi:hypothetical protein
MAAYDPLDTMGGTFTISVQVRWNTNQTCCTFYPYFYNFPEYVAAISSWPSFDPLPPPKNWRWFDVFRTALEEQMLGLMLIVHLVFRGLLRVANALSLAQQRAEKHRTFVQRLR